MYYIFIFIYIIYIIYIFTLYIYMYIRYIIENAIQEITNCIMRIGLATNVVINRIKILAIIARRNIERSSLEDQSCEKRETSIIDNRTGILSVTTLLND